MKRFGRLPLPAVAACGTMLAAGGAMIPSTRTNVAAQKLEEMESPPNETDSLSPAEAPYLAARGIPDYERIPILHPDARKADRAGRNEGRWENVDGQ